MAVDLWLLKRGHKVGLDDGSEAMVLDETQDGDWIRVRYLSSEDDESLPRTEDLVNSEEVEALLGVARTEEWGNEIGVTLLLEPGSEGYPRLYKATTMSGIPYGVVVSGESEKSGQEAVEHLVSGLRTFGFSGPVLIHDVTVPGRSEQHSLQV